MKRTINYTGRKSIRQEDATITLRARAGGASEFDASLSLSNYELPESSSVFVEAYRQNTWMRFRWGTVGVPSAPADRVLSEFDSPDDILFRVKVVTGEPHGQLLAEADRIRPRGRGDTDSTRSPLLPVKAEDLGEEAWKVEIDAPTTRLLVNTAFGNVHAVVLSPEFRTLVLPAVLRTILTQALCDRDSAGALPTRGEDEASGEEQEWQPRWVRFCQLLPGVESEVDPFAIDEVDARQDWIDGAVRAYCRRQKLGETFRDICDGGSGE